MECEGVVAGGVVLEGVEDTTGVVLVDAGGDEGIVEAAKSGEETTGVGGGKTSPFLRGRGRTG